MNFSRRPEPKDGMCVLGCSHAAFPLTPTLSPGERELESVAVDSSDTSCVVPTPIQTRQHGQGWGTVPPSPVGEGRLPGEALAKTGGEGEQRNRHFQECSNHHESRT